MVTVSTKTKTKKKKKKKKKKQTRKKPGETRHMEKKKKTRQQRQWGTAVTISKTNKNLATKMGGKRQKKTTSSADRWYRPTG